MRPCPLPGLHLPNSHPLTAALSRHRAPGRARAPANAQLLQKAGARGENGAVPEGRRTMEEEEEENASPSASSQMRWLSRQHLR